MAHLGRARVQLDHDQVRNVRVDHYCASPEKSEAAEGIPCQLP